MLYVHVILYWAPSPDLELSICTYTCVAVCYVLHVEVHDSTERFKPSSDAMLSTGVVAHSGPTQASVISDLAAAVVRIRYAITSAMMVHATVLPH